MKFVKSFFVIAVLLATPVGAADNKAGWHAYQSGDYQNALREFQPRAEKGDPPAQTMLGMMYENGHGVPQNYKIAFNWYRKAAEQGNPHAQFKLGLMYTKGQGIPQDDKLAVQWYRKAAEQGHDSAHHYLGLKYGNGQGVPQDYVTAHMWANISAANGNKPRLRDWIAARMTSDQLAEAQRRARVCMASDYKNCD
jgi:TPR repeat protein